LLALPESIKEEDYMPFNGPIDGNYDNVNWNEGPWKDDHVMTLTHDEVLQVQAGFEKVIDDYKPEDNFGAPMAETQVHSDYNKLDWQYAINWSTFNAVRAYNPEVDTDGIAPEAPIEEQIPEGPAE
jgi:hypothetical protein